MFIFNLVFEPFVLSCTAKGFIRSAFSQIACVLVVTT